VSTVRKADRAITATKKATRTGHASAAAPKRPTDLPRTATWRVTTV